MPVKTFISYHHGNDQWAKDHLIGMNAWNAAFEDGSVNSGDIDDTYMNDEEIRVRVRDEYLRDTTVTMVLVGLETRYRKHVDWELYSSMRDSALNPKSGIVLVPLPITGITDMTAAHGAEEIKALYPDVANWGSLNRGEYEARYPSFSTRMIDNLVSGTAKMSVVPWQRLTSSIANLKLAIELAHRDRGQATYDFSTSMRRKNGTGARR